MIDHLRFVACGLFLSTYEPMPEGEYRDELGPVRETFEEALSDAIKSARKEADKGVPNRYHALGEAQLCSIYIEVFGTDAINVIGRAFEKARKRDARG